VGADIFTAFQIQEAAVDAGGLQRLVLLDCDHPVFKRVILLFGRNRNAIPDLQIKEFPA